MLKGSLHQTACSQSQGNGRRGEGTHSMTLHCRTVVKEYSKKMDLHLQPLRRAGYGVYTADSVRGGGVLMAWFMPQGWQPGCATMEAAR